ncbi:aminotransferase class V-fold PLP-dependent enzyme [Microbacterium forte]
MSDGHDRAARLSLAEEFADRGDTAYFDTASVGLVPARVTGAVTETMRALEQGTRGSERWHALTDPAAALLAEEWKVNSGSISFVSSTGEAMNAVARALALGRGEEVVAARGDFPQTHLPFRALGTGRLRLVDAGAAGDRTSALLDALTPATRAVVVTHVHAETGDELDLRSLSAACRANDTLLIVDGAQAAGIIPVPTGLCDIYTAVGYKWLCAGFGIAAVHRSARYDAAAQPGLRGYANEGPESRELRTGHLNLVGAAALTASLTLRSELGIATLERLALSVRDRIADSFRAKGLDVRSGGGIVSIASRDADRTVAELAARGVQAAVRGGRVRVSPHFYTTEEEVQRLLEAVDDLVDPFAHQGEGTP